MDYSSRRPHRVPLLSVKNRKRRIQFAPAHQNWTIEDWKNVAWSDESQFLLRHSDGRVRIWRKEHESMDPSCLVSMVLAGGGGVMVWGIFSWHTLGPLSTNWASFKRHRLPEYCCWHVHPFMTTVYHLLMYFQQDNAPCHKAQIISDWFLEHDNEFTSQMDSTVTRSQSNRAPLGCGGTGDLHHGRAADKSAATAWCYHVNMNQNLWGFLSNTLLNLCHDELRQFWRQKGVQHVTSKVYVIKLPVSVCVVTSNDILNKYIYLLFTFQSFSTKKKSKYIYFPFR